MARQGACGRKIEPMDKPKQERRNDARYILKGAHISFKGHGATIDCTVRNMSNRGASLNVENSIGIPDSFDLMLDHAPVQVPRDLAESYADRC
jgi:hypothetical protein